MRWLRFSPRFIEDLDDIWFYIAQHNLVAADRFVESVQRRCRILESFPEAGPVLPRIASECRFLTEGHFLILYRLHDDETVVLRVIDGRREVTSADLQRAD